MLLLTAAAGRDATIPDLLRKVTRIAVREMVWDDRLDPEAFDDEVKSHLPDTEAVLVDLAANEPGIALCTRIHAWRTNKGARIKLFALGAEGVEEHEDSAFLAGCDAFLGRPFNPVELLERLRRLEAWQLRGAHRAPLQVGVTLAHATGTHHRGTVVDLSESGLLFDSEEPIAVGQNIALNMEIPDAPPVLSWIRVVRTMPTVDSVSPYSAQIAAEFLNLSASGRDTIRAAIARMRREEFESRLDDEYATKTIVITDHQTESVADWLHFLFTPVAFGSPPSPCGVPERVLKQWALRLPPNEEQLFRDLVVAPSDRTSSVRWMRAWVGFRVRLFYTAMEGQLADDAESIPPFLDRARDLLTILSESLTAWDLFEKDMPDADLYHERATVLLTLREGLSLREVYEAAKEEGDPSFLEAITRAEGFFSDRDFDDEQVTFEHGAFRGQEVKKRPKRHSQKQPPLIRRKLLVLGAIVVIAGGGLVISTVASVKNRVVEDEGVLLAFPVLAEAGYSRGEGPRVFVGAVDMGQWSMMSLSERRAAAESLRGFLEIDGVKSAIVSGGDAMAFQIERGKVLVVR
jgi:CheY-like chemotaxis protein